MISLERQKARFPMKRSHAVAIAVSLGALAIIGTQIAWQARQAPTYIEVDAGVIAMGKDLYSQRCASCHGIKLEGQPNWMQRKPDGKLPAPPHDATGHTWHHSDADLFKIVKNGVQAFAGKDYKTDMPSFEATLSDDQIKATIAFIKSTWPEKQRNFQEQISKNAQGTMGN